MNRPLPVVFEPILVPKPWGGRALERLFGKALPGGVAIGESWELADLPGAESRVARGPLRGCSLRELVVSWGADLLGSAASAAIRGGGAPASVRFPLLVKFLDARETLSVQVHPAPRPGVADESAGVKHEAWYILYAEPGAELYVGLRDGVTRDDLRRTANTPACAELLRRCPARVGDCYYLPSGTVHALGGGIVVAEVQTPSDVTYRLYDWERVDDRGRSRELHIAEALANARIDPSASASGPIARSTLAGPGDAAVNEAQLVSCEKFTITFRQFSRASAGTSDAQPRVWIVLAGRGTLHAPGGELSLAAGDTALLPAAVRSIEVHGALELLEVVPGAGG